METNQTPTALAGNGSPSTGIAITRPIVPTGPDPGSEVATRFYVVIEVDNLEGGRILNLPLAGPYQAREQAQAARDRLLAAHPTARIERRVYEHFPEPERELEPESAVQVVRRQLEEIIEGLCNAMGSVSIVEAAAPSDVAIGEPDYKRGARAIYRQLDDVLTQINALDGDLERAVADPAP